MLGLHFSSFVLFLILLSLLCTVLIIRILLVSHLPFALFDFIWCVVYVCVCVSVSLCLYRVFVHLEKYDMQHSSD